MNKKFPALSFVAGVYIVIGWLMVAASVCLMFVGAMVGTQARPDPSWSWLSIWLVIGLLFAGIFIVAQGELFKVLMTIESNTASFESNTKHQTS